MSKISIARCVGAITVLVLAVAIPLRGGFADTQLASWGDPLLTWEGVTVYYNGEDYHYSNGDSGYGVRWHCVELVSRFYSERLGFPRHWHEVEHAFQMFDQNYRDIARITNGGSRAPAPTDILVFDEAPDWPKGHVALVTRVAGGRVHFIQQNHGTNAEDSLPIDDGNRIDGEDRYPPVRGWLHFAARTEGVALSECERCQGASATFLTSDSLNAGPWPDGGGSSIRVSEGFDAALFKDENQQQQGEHVGSVDSDCRFATGRYGNRLPIFPGSPLNDALASARIWLEAPPWTGGPQPPVLATAVTELVSP